LRAALLEPRKVKALALIDHLPRWVNPALADFLAGYA
jgi:hypothetical protein